MELDKINLRDVLHLLDNETPIDLDVLLNDARIDPAQELRPPSPALVQITDNDERILCTLENIMLISGKAKSRKSFLMTMLTASLVSDRIVNNIKGCVNDKKGIYVDTEQSKYHVQLLYKRICKMSNKDLLQNVDVLALRKHKPSERLKALEYALYNTDNLGFCIIDGIKDLITSINDEDQATMVVSKLMKWSEDLNIAIIVVLHQNKSDNNARGHIGTELINKCETHLSVRKSDGNDDISIVEAQGCRNREPEKFAFEIVDNIPQLIEDFEVKTTKDTNKLDFDNIADYKIFSMLNAIYSKNEELSYSRLVGEIKYQFKNDFKNTIGTNKAKELITLCKRNNWIIQDEPKKPYKLGKYDTPDSIEF
ncbi:hypothetical protein AAT17_07105 [Nonlabens sp. MIC269]|uniref:AAA family ATPase n=1 Tax=Nonlabens sp. MIC269 TaxID=1476901 RepID=UPI000721379B|nr:AAA family ATPase [Nonlabens sp. MIC269]ALM21006.1 hypothetical protein AAT17_07105 [Nonlabens sp. MIC269]